MLTIGEYVLTYDKTISNIMGIISCIIIWACYAVIHALSFYLLVRTISFKQSFKLIATAVALNKILFTGSGYLASSYYVHKTQEDISSAVSAFILLESMNVLLWLPLGVFHGVKIAVQFPLIYILIAILVIFIVVIKRNLVRKMMAQFLKGMRVTGTRVVGILPLIAINAFLVGLYYYVLLAFYGYTFSVPVLVKIMSITITLSYFSPSPTGLGFKEAGFIGLLVEEGVPLSQAALIAITDRMITTLFWLVLGISSGYTFIHTALKQRFSLQKSSQK